MTTIDRQSQNKLVLYPPTKPLIETKMHMWVGQQEGEETYPKTIHPLLTIEISLAMKNTYEDTFISNYMQNFYSSSIKIEDYNGQGNTKKSQISIDLKEVSW